MDVRLLVNPNPSFEREWTQQDAARVMQPLLNELGKHSSTHEASEVRCGLCYKSYCSMKYVKQHIATVHRRRRDFECNVCDQRFGTKSSMTRHKKAVHFRERHFACSLCSKTFGTRSCVERHQRKVHAVARIC
mmetsp:Transcript_11662/g.35584  ORF Transcript_11662/g.35584 Transcript_11662/m.35584 type:complete len:133 (+) Transcript_11662:54-452(+)